MRLWHSKLIPLLDNPRLSDLHMSCCNLRGNGWGKRNININYIYDDSLGEDALAVYHMEVLREMEKRGYNFNQNWWNAIYCGKNRPSRKAQPYKFEEAYRRDIPLKGHTPRFFLDDVETLQARGLDIELTQVTETDSEGKPYTVYTVQRNGVKSVYGVRL